MRVSRVRVVFLFLTMGLLLSGCWNSTDIDNVDYVNAIGIDYSNEEKQYQVYLQLLSFDKVAKSEQGMNMSPTPVWIAVGKGKSYAEAIEKITVESQRRLFWGHVTSLIIGESLLEKGEITTTLQSLFRFYELRYTMWVFGTSDPITEIFQATPNFERSRLRLMMHTPKDNYKQRSYIAPIRLNDFLASYYEPVQSLLLPSITVGKEVWRKNNEPVDSLRYNGVYSFWQQKKTGFFPVEKVKGLRWMDRKTNRAPVTIKEGGKNVAGARLRKPRFAVKINEEGGKPSFDIHVIVKGAISELSEQVPESVLIRQLQSMVEQEIRETYSNGVKQKTDLLGLGKHLYDRSTSKYRMYADKGDMFLLTPESLRNVRVEVELTSAGKYTYRTYKDND
ncbi:Ger(x)C family spore germination protein [Paenibacillus sp. UNC451MF]|uniref:Ger(x)C family spore germination protein n=1 Tax=Paenibacillus sp. UNC451MF TaxID=1449063 RepID=UPI00068AB627|nr:Ger(x)C family spore germination protein [Paenibacillus sp. UNC451MF]